LGKNPDACLSRLEVHKVNCWFLPAFFHLGRLKKKLSREILAKALNSIHLQYVVQLFYKSEFKIVVHSTFAHVQGINVVWDKYLKNTKYTLQERKVREKRNEIDPEDTLVLNLFPDKLQPVVQQINPPFVFTLKFEVKVDICLLGLQILSRSTEPFSTEATKR